MSVLTVSVFFLSLDGFLTSCLKRHDLLQTYDIARGNGTIRRMIGITCFVILD